MGIRSTQNWLVFALVQSICFGPALPLNSAHASNNPSLALQSAHPLPPLVQADNPDLTNQLNEDIKAWDPREMFGDHDYQLKYAQEEIRRQISEAPPSLEASDQQWLDAREEIASRSAEIAEKMLIELDRVTFKQGMTQLLTILRDVEITSHQRQKGFWDRVVAVIGNEEARARQKDVIATDYEKADLKDVKDIYERMGTAEFRKLVLSITTDPATTETHEQSRVRLLIDQLGAIETAKDLSANKVPLMKVEGLGRFEFSLENGIPFVRAVHEATGHSLLVIRKRMFESHASRHLKQIIARQNLDAGETDKFGRKQGRHTAVVIQEHGKVWSLIEHMKPTKWVDRMQTYYYATVKGMSVWRTMFGISSGLFQTGMTYWLASFADRPTEFSVALVSFLFGTVIGANLGTYQNMIERGALQPISYHDEAWRSERNIFKRFKGQLESIAWGPTVGSRYFRGMYVSVLFANLLMLAKHSHEISFTSLAGVGATLAIFGTEVLWKISANTWASNQGKTGVEEFIRFLRSKRVFMDNVKFKVFGIKVGTDIQRLSVLHQSIYNPTNNTFKLMDYLTPWGYFIFTSGNFLNLMLQKVGLRATARAAHALDPKLSSKYYRLYESSVMNVLYSTLLRLFTGKTHQDRVLSWVKPEEAEAFLKSVEEIRQNAELSAEQKQTEVKKQEDRIYELFVQSKEERLDKVFEAWRARAAAAAEISREIARGVVRPFAPVEYREQLSPTSWDKVRASCRALLSRTQ